MRLNRKRGALSATALFWLSIGFVTGAIFVLPLQCNFDGSPGLLAIASIGKFQGMAFGHNVKTRDMLRSSDLGGDIEKLKRDGQEFEQFSERNCRKFTGFPLKPENAIRR
jgi:hypothetical protein